MVRLMVNLKFLLGVMFFVSFLFCFIVIVVSLWSVFGIV